jgi:hypothetical protein
MSIEKYGSAQSATKGNLLVSQLSPAALDAELSFWQKEVAKYDRSIKSTAAGSSERGKLAQQLELAMERVIQTQAVLAQKSKDYQPIAGPQTASIKKDIAAANKYKGLNVDSLVSTAESIRSGMMPSGTSPRSYVLGSVTSSLLQPVLSKNWAATQTAGRPTTVQDTDQRGFNEAVQEAMRTGQATTPATPATPRSTTSPTVTSTPGGGGSGKGTVVFDGKRVKVGSDKWKTIIQEEFGGLWDVYNDNADVKKVIDRAVKEGWFNDETKLTASLQSTNWYRTTEQSARQYAIRLSSDPATIEDEITTEVENLRAGSLAVGLTLDDGTLRRLATNKIKFGWSPQQTTNAIGSEAVALAQTGGAQGMTDLRQGSVGRKLRETARLYAQKPADADLDTWVADIMTGRKTETQWEDFMRNSAKTQFRSLAPALDRGDTVEDATYAYRQQALQTLGGTIDPSQIDWTQDKWNKALNFNDPKTNESRQMDLWEWNKYLRTLPEWQQTEDAKQVYRNVAYSLSRGFGKMA